MTHLYLYGTTQAMETKTTRNSTPNRSSSPLKTHALLASEDANTYTALQILIRKTMEQLLRPLVERIQQLNRTLDSEEDNWETISGIQRICGISFYRARKVCLTAGVRTLKSRSSGWPRFNVEDCRRILAGETLPSSTVAPVISSHIGNREKQRCCSSTV